jgi:putative oxygen-independent coproporphyrinogen III oxidase
MELPPLGLYIHLPWCERKCPYCDFNSHQRSALPQQAYVDALLEDLRGDLPLAQGREVQTLFIGGGTPSLFGAGAIARLLAGIRELLPLAPEAEVTLEANPGSAGGEKLCAFREAGVNRLSLGVQSFDDASLRALGRIHDGEQARAAVALARAAGFDNLNLDLMHGLPGQSAASAGEDLRSAIDCRPAHLSWYQLTIEPNTLFHNRPPPLPAEEALAEIQAEGERLLAGAGYNQYEVSAYARPGRECRHNLNYWNFGDYLGIGAGAHGKVSFPDGRVRRSAKRRRPESYLAARPGEHSAGCHEVPPEELGGEFVLNALRLNGGFSLARYRARTGLDPAGLTPQLASLRGRDLLLLEGDRVTATALGRRFLDTVIAEFFPD